VAILVVPRLSAEACGCGAGATRPMSHERVEWPRRIDIVGRIWFTRCIYRCVVACYTTLVRLSHSTLSTVLTVIDSNMLFVLTPASVGYGKTASIA